MIFLQLVLQLKKIVQSRLLMIQKLQRQIAFVFS